jgi:hypothetical protein
MTTSLVTTVKAIKTGFFELYKRHVEIQISNNCDFVLHMSLEWKEKSLYLSQNRQIERLIEKYNLKESKQTFKTPMEAKLNLMAGPKYDLPDVPYAQSVCALLLIARCTRPDILFSVTFLCTYLTIYTTAHFNAEVRVFTYLKCTMDFKLSYRAASSDVQPVEIYIDSVWGGL